MRDLSDFYQPDWQKGQNVEGLRFSEVGSETRKHWKPFEECTVQPQCTPGPLSFHRRITVCCVCCKSRSNTSSSWDEWNETAGIHPYGSWVRWKNPSAFRRSLRNEVTIGACEAWAWALEGGGWTSPTTTTSVSWDAALIIYVMDYGLSWHGNPGNHFPRSYSTISSAAFQAGSVHEGANVSGALPALWQQPSSSFVQVSQNSIGIWHRHWNLAMEKGVEDWRLL